MQAVFVVYLPAHVRSPRSCIPRIPPLHPSTEAPSALCNIKNLADPAPRATSYSQEAVAD